MNNIFGFVLFTTIVGLVSCENKSCCCSVRLIDHNDQVYSTVEYKYELGEVRDCTSSTAIKTCATRCNRLSHKYNTPSLWKIESTNGKTKGDISCRQLKMNFENIRVQNFIDLCQKYNWHRGNITSEPLSCKNGKMVQ
ncbi:Uncharacterised protein g3018 [Pycnogonum litorale]